MSDPILSPSSALPSRTNAAAGHRLTTGSVVHLARARSSKFARALVLGVTLALYMAAVPVSPTAATTVETGWVGYVSTSTWHQGTDADAGIIFSTRWNLDGILDQELDPFTSPDAAAFTTRARWTMTVHQLGNDWCDPDLDGVLDRFHWSREATVSGAGTVTIQYGVENNPNAYRLSPVPDGGSATAEMPPARTMCGAHPVEQVVADLVSTPIADHAAPVDTYGPGYTWITGGDSLGNAVGIEWNLFRAAALAFNHAAYSVDEDQPTATITVTRSGATEMPPIEVHYSATAGTATPGSDFVATSGVLSFAAGETSKSFPVTILPDTLPEGPETIAVTLGETNSGAALLTNPSTATLTIRASDQQPDAFISTRSTSGFVGNNIYNTTGSGQTKSLSAAAGRARTFYARVYNDGNVANTIILKGSPARSGSKVQYFTGTTNLTATMRSPTGLRVRLAPGAHKQVRIRVSVLSKAVIGSLKPAIVTGSWVGDGVRSDVGKAIVKVVR